MAHRRAFWEWAFHAPLDSSLALANRRKLKLRATQARMVFTSFCIETWGFYAFLEKLDEHPQLYWLGRQPGRTSNDAASYNGHLADDLASLSRRD